MVVLLGAGFTTRTARVDVADQDSVRGLAGIAVDLLGVAYVLEELGRVIAAGGSGIVIASQADYMIPPLPTCQHTTQ